MLLKADSIAKKHARFVIPFFKVPKKNPEESRPITDGREVNGRIAVFEGEKMNPPILHMIMLWGSTHPIKAIAVLKSFIAFSRSCVRHFNLSTLPLCTDSENDCEARHRPDSSRRPAIVAP